MHYRLVEYSKYIYAYMLVHVHAPVKIPFLALLTFTGINVGCSDERGLVEFPPLYLTMFSS